MSTAHPQHLLLIATVGSTAEPLAVSILHWRPARVQFVFPASTGVTVDTIRQELHARGFALPLGAYDSFCVSDHDDLAACVQEMRSNLAKEVSQWWRRGDRFRCVVDFTCGTKCMSVALGLLARPWPAVRFSYVGGEARDKEGAGRVLPGSERVVTVTNPWGVLGYQAIEDAVTAFDHHDYSEGARWLREANRQVGDDASRKSELNALATFMEGYELWDRTEYREAFGKFDSCSKRLNDLAGALAGVERQRLREHLREARDRLDQLKRDAGIPTRALLEDLIANAERRRNEGRYVDAVARLYRAVELAAQLRLVEGYGITTDAVPVDELPEHLRRLPTATDENGTIMVGLQDAYALLLHKDDSLGERFAELGWNSARSPLASRNASIAGHGFAPVSKDVCADLWNGALSLAGLSEEQVFQFPTLRKTNR